MSLRSLRRMQRRQLTDWSSLVRLTMCSSQFHTLSPSTQHLEHRPFWSCRRVVYRRYSEEHYSVLLLEWHNSGQPKAALEVTQVLGFALEQRQLSAVWLVAITQSFVEEPITAQQVLQNSLMLRMVIPTARQLGAELTVHLWQAGWQQGRRQSGLNQPALKSKHDKERVLNCEPNSS